MLHNRDMVRSGKKSSLAPWQLEDAARLRDLLAKHARKPDGESQAAFAERWDIGTQSHLSQLATGYRPLNLETTLKLAKGLRVPIAEISPRMAEILATAPPAYADGSPPPPKPKEKGPSALDVSMLAALRSLDPVVSESIRTMIHAIATAANERHAEFMRSLDAFNHKRDRGADAKPGMKKARSRAQ